MQDMKKGLKDVLAWMLCLVMLAGAVACTGEKGASGKKVAVPEVQQKKPVVTHGKHREICRTPGNFAAEEVVVENNALGLPSGLQSYVQAVASWDQYAVTNELTPEQKQAGLNKLAQGDMPEGANIPKVIVEAYKDGVLAAGAAYLGPAASAGKVVGGALIGAIANGSYQWFDMSQPGNENKSYDYLGTGSAAVTGGLAPGRGIWQNVGIATGGAIFTDGPDAGAVGASAAGAWAGGMFGEYAPGLVNSVIGKELPGFIYDIGGAFASEAATDAGKSIINEKENGK
ncbi:adhesin [Erwinia pyrifoliae]|uniref:adhesin n=1 Tax=Erwinia pyrifoliae TaxID=79967 RepID=UPI00220DA823|nr:adhesin [Erwinia pyrifoliae]UWS30009.1 adhesin [Erwinia pyrifoliae]